MQARSPKLPPPCCYCHPVQCGSACARALSHIISIYFRGAASDKVKDAEGGVALDASDEGEGDGDAALGSTDSSSSASLCGSGGEPADSVADPGDFDEGEEEEELETEAEEEEDDEGVWWDPATSQVWDGPPHVEGRVIIGRISSFKEHTPQADMFLHCFFIIQKCFVYLFIYFDIPQAAISVYCRRHGCTFCKRVEQCPSQRAMLEWFAEGLRIPKGRDEQQRRHKGKFPTPDA